MTEATTDVHPVSWFDEAIANQVGVIRSNLEQVLDRNPDLDPVVTQRLAVIVGKCIPLSDAAHVRRLRLAGGGASMTGRARRSSGSD